MRDKTQKIGLCVMLEENKSNNQKNQSNQLGSVF